MAAYLFWSDAAPQKLLSIVVIALCAAALHAHVWADHVAPPAEAPSRAGPDAEPSLFLAAGGLVPDGSPAIGGTP